MRRFPSPIPLAARRPPIDPLTGPKLALAGRVVTMDAAFRVVGDGVVYIEKGGIADVADRAQPAPAGFEGVAVVETGGTLFPGLIELHNHLSYNALRTWDVPKPFGNREGWGGIAEYRKRISGPMQVIGRTPRLLPALVRYVECKCLLAGVTTSQGIQLASNAGVRRFYRGIVRNVEQTDMPDLPEAVTRIDDVEARDAALFLARLKKQTCFLLHMAEGIDDAARKHFLALRIDDAAWAITPQLAGIHCAGLHPEDFAVLARLGGAMIWSPMSNLLLYGKTAAIQAAKTEGVRLGIGSDWSPTGSKNLLGELKVARLTSAASGDVFRDRDVVAMATREAAGILGWSQVVGMLTTSQRADVLVIGGQQGDPYEALLQAGEAAIQLVMVNGVARYGVPGLMDRLSPGGERLTVGGAPRQLFLTQATGDPDVGAVSLGTARDTLTQALRDLPRLARQLETPTPASRIAAARALAGPQPLVWTLALDELQETGVDLRPRLPLEGRFTGPGRPVAQAAKPLSTILEPLTLDALTVADDGDFLDRLGRQRNLPAAIKDGLPALY